MALGEKTDPKRLKHLIRLVFQLLQKFPFTYVTNNYFITSSKTTLQQIQISDILLSIVLIAFYQFHTKNSYK